MLIHLFFIVATASQPCELPPKRDVAALSRLAKAAGFVSVSLFTVATECFETHGAWTADTYTAAPAVKTPYCTRAVATCTEAKAALTSGLHQLLASTLKEFKTSFFGAQYTPQHSNLTNRTFQAPACTSKVQGELLSQAATHMDIARLASQAQSEYRRYRNWLSKESATCAARLSHGEAPVLVGGPTLERQRALASSMKVKWRYLTQQRALLERDADWTLGFLSSWELRRCACRPIKPQDILRRLETKDNVQALQKDDAKNTMCEVCLQDAYEPWKTRVQKQCAQMDELTEYELKVLKQSVNGYGLPPRCFDEARARRAAAAAKPTVPTAPPPSQEARRAGRVYYRLRMDPSCSATVEPGSARVFPGKFIQVPIETTLFSITSQCDGSIEFYVGRNAQPKLTEALRKGKPLRLRFRKPAQRQQ